MDKEIITGIIAAIGGGGLTQFFNWRNNRRKGASEAKGMEIENIKSTVDKVYKPLIEQLNSRVEELTRENSDLRKQVQELQGSIVKIYRTLGLSASAQLRDGRGRYVKQDSEQ